MTSLGILSIATNKYLEYWKDQAKSVDCTLSTELDVTLHVFTDRTTEAELFSTSLSNSRVVVHEIPALGWPEATLHRYRIFHKMAGMLHEDILMYLDADMLVHAPFTSELQDLSSDVTLIRHPGYYRPRFPQSIGLYARNPKLLLADIIMRRDLGGIGAWETNKDSRAYVPRKNRRSYYCGGIWWGSNAAIRELVEQLSGQVDNDEENLITAIWHDESHLNRWAAMNKKRVLDSRFCYSKGYEWLRKVPNIVQAVDKQDVVR